ncbi:MAG: hypothetical protein ABI208_00735, partial [Ginsengibacter sp.]
KTITNFYQLVFLFCMISVPMLGIFVDLYAGFETTLPLICFLIYGLYLRFSYYEKNLKVRNIQSDKLKLKPPHLVKY